MSIGSICYGLVLLAPISLALTLVAHLTAFLVLSPRRRKRTDVVTDQRRDVNSLCAAG